MFSSNDTKWAAINACGGMSNLNRECVLDIAITGNTAVGQATSSGAAAFESEKAALSKY